MKKIHYIELDALLDTRLGTISRFSEELVQKIDSATYHSRRGDFFDGISDTQYRALYKERDIETLALSKVTNLVFILRELTKKSIEQMSEIPFMEGFGFVINAWPYNLSTEEANGILSAFINWMGTEVSVEMISVAPADVNPTFCKDYTTLFIYNYEEWLTENVNKFIKEPARNLTVFAPAIFVASNPTDEEIQDHVKKVMHPFQMLEFTLKSVMDFQLIDVANFSILERNKIPGA